ncbi:MAG: hypothetical protein HFJ75_09025 [Eggerthellaceae bacterium]|nr:hypothetical protein [Eggerthellaceae bacterium]
MTPDDPRSKRNPARLAASMGQPAVGRRGVEASGATNVPQAVPGAADASQAGTAEDVSQDAVCGRVIRGLVLGALVVVAVVVLLMALAPAAAAA